MTRLGSRTRGFTLIELLIAVAIVAVLGMVAMPSYVSYMVRTQRAAAATCLTEFSGFMERVYATNMRYDQNNGAATTLPTLQCATDLNGRYALALDGGALLQRAFRLTATPQGTQATRDAACGTLSINQAGTKAISGSSTVAKCWS